MGTTTSSRYVCKRVGTYDERVLAVGIIIMTMRYYVRYGVNSHT